MTKKNAVFVLVSDKIDRSQMARELLTDQRITDVWVVLVGKQKLVRSFANFIVEMINLSSIPVTEESGRQRKSYRPQGVAVKETQGRYFAYYAKNENIPSGSAVAIRKVAEVVF